MSASDILAWTRRLLAAAMLALTLGGVDSTEAANLSPGGGPVMVNPIKVYLIYWLPAGFVLDATVWERNAGIGNFELLTQRFFNDISATSYFNIVIQYPGTCGSSSCVVQNIAGAVALAGHWVDAQAYPHAGTQSDALQDIDIQNEIQRAISQNHWSVDANSEFFVFTGVNEINGDEVEECQTAVSCTFNAFCAYHGYSSINKAPYAYLSDASFNSSGCSEGINYAPNGQLSSDREVVLMSHEFFESVTDPLQNCSGWCDPVTGQEMADKCSQGVDVYLNGNLYAVQQQWDNNSSQCQPLVPPKATCPVDVTDCTGELTISCNGPDVGIVFNGNCHDVTGQPVPCYAGFTGASTVSAGGNVDWIGSTTSPNVATVCTENALGETCTNVSAPVPAPCQVPPGPPVPQCGPSEKWCLRFTPPQCAPIKECLVTPAHP
jgi:hypothetical protein